MKRMEESKPGKKSEPEVVLFGKDVSGRSHKCNDDSGVVWGVFLIFAGAVLLLNTFSVIPWTIWETLLMFWPVLLILGGVHIVLGNSFISRIFVSVFSVFLLGTVFLLAIRQFRPDLLTGLPPDITNYLNSVAPYLKKP